MMRSKSGFSLIELLTVIAIIAILAAIIFPVMSVVKARAKVVKCQTNLHEIAMALKMFKEDNRRYPTTLGGYVLVAGGVVQPMEQAKSDPNRGDSLYPEYIKSVLGFHCPMSPTTQTNAVLDLTTSGNTNSLYYAYDSYDAYSKDTGNQTISGADADNAVRYTTWWAGDVNNLGPAGALPPYPPGAQDPDSLRQYDYKRQLRFRYTSDDTVVTWCSYHERAGDPRSMVPVLFLSGQCDMMPAPDINASKWRTHPKAGG